MTIMGPLETSITTVPEKSLESLLENPRPFLRSAFRTVCREASLRLNGKDYLVDRRAFLAHLRADALVHTALASALLELHRAVGDRIAGRLPPTYACDCTLVLLPWLANFGRAVSYPTVTRLLEGWCLEHLGPRITGSKLVKDIFFSSLRKFCRLQSKELVAQRMLSTAAKASLLPTLAIFLVEQAVLLWNGAPSYGRETLRQVVRAVGAIGGAAIGAALGSLVEPGAWTLLGAGLGQVLCTLPSPADRVYPRAYELFAPGGDPLYIVSVGADKHLVY
ncbi:hypothetical protein ACHHYP_13126 [Achlya hypogyna]|uniref:Uncharacterized protein n=1 Tax=Achlya hypogyna TaxID=1202772 RepID=A0A1V9YG01_ACHHY|nr:hypothetical protein ACHHYP_13126 [Achlya hypogyna]